MLKMKPHIAEEHFDLIRNQDQYDALEDKYSYDVMVVQYGGPFMTFLLND